MIVFFESSCTISNDISPQWRSIGSLRRYNVTVPVQWVSVNPRDSAAGMFMRSRGVPGHPLYVRSTADLARLGVAGYPRVYLIGTGGVFLGELPRDPVKIDSFPAMCREAPGEHDVD